MASERRIQWRWVLGALALGGLVPVGLAGMALHDPTPQLHAKPLGGAPAWQASGFVEDAVCQDCHDDLAVPYAEMAHGRADMPAWSGVQGCQACHGPGEAHVDSGDAADILSFNNAAAEDANASCMNCHTSEHPLWAGSAHEAAELTCTDCHSLHTPWQNENALKRVEATFSTRPQLPTTQVTANCLTCHENLNKSMFQRSNHPLDNGQMSCASCHDPHGSMIEADIDALSLNTKCYECHAETRGPFLWDHIPVRENCMTCHSPHGSNQTKLLTAAPPRLCQSCHMLGHHQTVPGFDQQIWNTNRSCVNCHSNIHGSNHPAGILFMR